jgi:hypothetical protein
MILRHAPLVVQQTFFISPRLAVVLYSQERMSIYFLKTLLSVVMLLSAFLILHKKYSFALSGCTHQAMGCDGIRGGS